MTLLRVSPFWDLIYSPGLAGKKSTKYMFKKLVTWNQCLLVIFLYLVIIGIACGFSTTFFFYIQIKFFLKKFSGAVLVYLNC
jgi:hypothetical protein